MDWRKHGQVGYAWIGAGLVLIVLAQFWSAFPVATSIALVGQGAILLLQAGPHTSRQDSLMVLNVTVYGVLVCLAIAAESNAVMREAAAEVTLPMLLDHAVAIVVVIGQIVQTFHRLSQPTT